MKNQNEFKIKSRKQMKEHYYQVSGTSDQVYSSYVQYRGFSNNF